MKIWKFENIESKNGNIEILHNIGIPKYIDTSYKIEIKHLSIMIMNEWMNENETR